jgi:hypothetical protein
MESDRGKAEQEHLNLRISTIRAKRNDSSMLLQIKYLVELWRDLENI